MDNWRHAPQRNIKKRRKFDCNNNKNKNIRIFLLVFESIEGKKEDEIFLSVSMTERKKKKK